MKILQINKYFRLVGGAERYFLEVSRLLRRHGHEVAFFSMADRRNDSSVWNKYFVSNVSFENKSLSARLRYAARTLYSFEAKEKIIRLIDNFRPNIVHIHDLSYFISPSILPVIKKRGIPVVQTVPNYHLISPNANLFHDGKICEITKKRSYYKAIFHKCVPDSLSSSFLHVTAKYMHDFLRLYNNVDNFITPSNFLRNKLIDYGIPKEKILKLPYFNDCLLYKPKYKVGNYILYFGRLSEEKGLDVLIQAMHKLPNILLKIAGSGLDYYPLRNFVDSLNIENVEFVGFQDREKLRLLIANSRFTIFPSVWYEVFGQSIIESYASRRPVIASRIGAIPEIVINGFNGLLFEPGNIDDCSDKINMLWGSISKCKEMGKNARELVEKSYSPISHYKELMQIYKNIINQYN